MAPLFSALFGDASRWENFVSDYPVLHASFGKGTNAAQPLAAPACRDGLAQLATRTPVVLAFVLDSECDYIYVAHSVTVFPCDIADPTAMDNQLVGLIGDRLDSTVPVVLPQPFFTVCGQVAALDAETIQGVGGHGAAPPIFRDGPHAGNAAHTTLLRARNALLMPPHLASLAIANAVEGRYTLLGFYNTFLGTTLAAGDAAAIAALSPVTQWWRLASTNNAAGTSVVSQALLNVGAPRNQARLNAWSSRVKDGQMARLGHGGSGLSNTAFSQGVSVLKTTIEANHLATLEYERARADKTFSDVHGLALGQQLHRLCNCHTDAGLPEVHHHLLKMDKGKAYALLGSLFAARARDSIVQGVAPLPTPQLVQDVFRNYSPGGDGLTFGKGLTPFAIVCGTHAEYKNVQTAIQQAQMLESGTSVSLADARVLLAEDARFPTESFVALEKLKGWSIVIDVFHGEAHPIAINVREAVLALASTLQRYAVTAGGTHAAGMELVCRVLYDMQQDYFEYLSRAAMGPAVPPTFATVVGLVRTTRISSLSPLPAAWYSMLSCPQPSGPVGILPPATAPAQLRTGGGGTTGPEVNAHADRRLMARFRGCGHANISDMVGTHTVTYPKQGGKDVCMAWALKGSCAANCRRKDQHVRYNQATMTALHKFLDDCGVAPSA